MTLQRAHAAREKEDLERRSPTVHRTLTRARNAQCTTRNMQHAAHNTVLSRWKRQAKSGRCAPRNARVRKSAVPAGRTPLGSRP